MVGSHQIFLFLLIEKDCLNFVKLVGLFLLDYQTFGAVILDFKVFSLSHLF